MPSSLCCWSSSSAILVLLLAACSGTVDGVDRVDGGSPPPGVDAGPPVGLGEPHTGEYHLGPVEWNGAIWNACAPYPAAMQELEGDLLAGLSNELAATGTMCDACIEITTGLGRSIVARVVTYGVSQGEGNLDLSPAAFAALHQDEFPRAMTWRLVTCPGSAPIYIQFQTGAHQDWSSLWVRNPRIALDRVEVKSERHASYAPLRRAPDGTFTDDGGFGVGPFTLRLTAIDGSVLEQSFPGFQGGDLLEGTANF